MYKTPKSNVQIRENVRLPELGGAGAPIRPRFSSRRLRSGLLQLVTANGNWWMDLELMVDGQNGNGKAQSLIFHPSFLHPRYGLLRLVTPKVEKIQGRSETEGRILSAALEIPDFKPAKDGILASALRFVAACYGLLRLTAAQTQVRFRSLRLVTLKPR